MLEQMADFNAAGNGQNVDPSTVDQFHPLTDEKRHPTTDMINNEPPSSYQVLMLQNFFSAGKDCGGILY
jgi:hypothetical protein